MHLVLGMVYFIFGMMHIGFEKVYLVFGNVYLVFGRGGVSGTWECVFFGVWGVSWEEVVYLIIRSVYLVFVLFVSVLSTLYLV